MSNSLENTQPSLDISHHRPPSISPPHHENTPRRRPPGASFLTPSRLSGTLHNKERRSFSDIPVSSRLPPIQVHSAGAGSFSSKPKLPVLEPGAANMNEPQFYNEIFGDFANQSTFPQPDMTQHQSLPTPQIYGNHYSGDNFPGGSINVDQRSSPISGTVHDGPVSDVQDHSLPTPQTLNYMPQGDASFNLYQPVPIPQSHGGQSNSMYAPVQQYDNFGLMHHNAHGYSAAPRSAVGMSSQQNMTQSFGSFSEPTHNNHNFSAQAYSHLTVENTSSSLLGDFGSSASYMPGSTDSAQKNDDDHVEHIPSPSPQISKRKSSKARSHSSKASTSALSSAKSSNCSASPPVKNETGLFFDGFAEAEAEAYNRSRPTLRHDDWSHIEKNPTTYVQKLLAAFGEDYAEQPENVILEEDNEKARWATYQDDHIEKVSKFDDKAVEAACWVLLKHLIEAHEIGMKPMRYHKIENNVQCSDHVDMVAAAIRDYGVIRYDVVRLQRLDELVCCTRSAISRKLANFKGNNNKAKREEENQRQAEQLGIGYTPVLGDKKRKATDASNTSKPAKKRVRSSAAAARNDPSAGPSTTPIQQQRKDSTSSEDIPLQKITSQQKTIAEMVNEATDPSHSPDLSPAFVPAGLDTNPSSSDFDHSLLGGGSYEY